MPYNHGSVDVGLTQTRQSLDFRVSQSAGFTNSNVSSISKQRVSIVICYHKKVNYYTL